MFCHVSLVLAGLLIALVGLAACTTTLVPKGASVEMPGMTPAPLVTDSPVPPVSNPSTADNTLTIVSDVQIDTSKFTTPAYVAGWGLSDDLHYATVTIGLSKDD
ncbi:MAG TPA: hypothetical protein VN081_04210 [Dongiaceae bacterium]|nr:hypothetical protein [Dongiaceae bacterium]